MSIVSGLSSFFGPAAAPPPPSASPSLSSTSSVSHADRAGVLAATKRDVSDRLEARRAERARVDLEDVTAANDAILRAERECSEARARSAAAISDYFRQVGGPIVARVRSTGTRAESEELRVLVVDADRRCRAELGEPMRYALIGYLVSGERRPHAIEGAAVASAPGTRASTALAAMALPGAFHDALRELDRAIEGALPESDLERWAVLCELVVESDAMTAAAALRRRRAGSAS